VAGPYRRAVAGSARGLRAVEDRSRAAAQVNSRRHPGAVVAGSAGRRRRGRRGGVDHQRRLQPRPRPPARRRRPENGAAPSRSRPSASTGSTSDAPAAGRPARSTWPWTGVACRWRCCARRVRPGTTRSCCRCWPPSGSRAQAIRRFSIIKSCAPVTGRTSGGGVGGSGLDSYANLTEHIGELVGHRGHGLVR
jgi:hypothetical protein